MNERIRELMVEAGYAAPEMAGRANKLAELIVKECVNNIKVWERDSRNHISYILKKHFGIKE